MAIVATRAALSRIFYQRCFWLFAVLLALIGAVSFVPASDDGRLFLNGMNMFLLIATVAAVGRTTFSFVVTGRFKRDHLGSNQNPPPVLRG